MSEPPTFVVRAWDGRVVDVIRPEELATVAAGQPEKAWHEAALWAHLALVRENPPA